MRGVKEPHSTYRDLCITVACMLEGTKDLKANTPKKNKASASVIAQKG